jgi:hypothetical protein
MTLNGGSSRNMMDISACTRNLFTDNVVQTQTQFPAVNSRLREPNEISDKWHEQTAEIYA